MTKLTDDSGDDVDLPCVPHCFYVCWEKVYMEVRTSKSRMREREREQEQDAPSASQLRFIRLSFSLSLSSPSYLCLEPLQLPEDARRGASRGRRAVLILRLGSLGRRGGGRGRHRRRRFSSCLDECSQVECFLACPASSLGSEEAASSCSLVGAIELSLSH